VSPDVAGAGWMRLRRRGDALYRDTGLGRLGFVAMVPMGGFSRDAWLQGLACCADHGREACMRYTVTPEIIFTVLVIALALAGFSGLYLGPAPRANAYHHVHVATCLGWLGLLLAQLVFLSRRRFRHHRAFGLSIFGVGPLLVATSVLLAVHSATRDAIAGRADVMVVPNVMGTLELALLIVLAFWLRGRREIHGALLMATSVLFMGTALFFTLIGFVPAYRIDGPGTFHRFAEAGDAATWAVALVSLGFFLRHRGAGWPWLLPGVFAVSNGLVQAIVAQNQGTMALTRVVAACDPAIAFVVSLLGYASLLWLVWIRPYRGRNQRGREPGGPQLPGASG
jgi:hypothetical protein